MASKADSFVVVFVQLSTRNRPRYWLSCSPWFGCCGCSCLISLGLGLLFSISCISFPQCDVSSSLFILSSFFAQAALALSPNEFFSLVSRFAGAGQESMQRFAVFCGLSWFAIVKGWHFAEFVILTLLTASAVKWWRNELTVWSIIASMLFCIAFAAADEWHQSFIPDRFGTVQDVFIDSLGIFAAGSTLLLRLNRRNANNKAVNGSRR